MKMIGLADSADLLQLHSEGVSRCTEFIASIPYASSGVAATEFFDSLKQFQINSKIYFRLDWSVPFNPSIIRQYSDKNIIFYAIANYLHAKIFWWKGWGVYIGSNNLTDRACFKNFESGIFVDEKEIYASNLNISLVKFFEGIDSASIDCSSNLLTLLDNQKTQLKDHLKARLQIESNFAFHLDKI